MGDLKPSRFVFGWGLAITPVKNETLCRKRAGCAEKLPENAGAEPLMRLRRRSAFWPCPNHRVPRSEQKVADDSIP